MNYDIDTDSVNILFNENFSHYDIHTCKVTG